MIHRALLPIAAALLAGTALAAPPQPVNAPANHPLLGKWQWTREDIKCTEVYEFRPDGRARVLSGKERTDNVFVVAAQPDEAGFYRMTLTVTKDYGGEDCAQDSEDSTGIEGQNYIMFNPSRTEYLSCYEPKVDKCYGPLKKVVPKKK